MVFPLYSVVIHNDGLKWELEFGKIPPRWMVNVLQHIRPLICSPPIKWKKKINREKYAFERKVLWCFSLVTCTAQGKIRRRRGRQGGAWYGQVRGIYVFLGLHEIHPKWFKGHWGPGIYSLWNGILLERSRTRRKSHRSLRAEEVTQSHDL